MSNDLTSGLLTTVEMMLKVVIQALWKADIVPFRVLGIPFRGKTMALAISGYI